MAIAWLLYMAITWLLYGYDPLSDWLLLWKIHAGKHGDTLISEYDIRYGLDRY